AGRRRWVAPGLILQALGRSADGGTADDGPPRVGFTASAKVGGAVVRNRARRRLRAVAQAVMAHARAGHDYVLIAPAGTVTRRFDALIGDLEAGLKRLGLYRDEAAAGAPAPRTETPDAA